MQGRVEGSKRVTTAQGRQVAGVGLVALLALAGCGAIGQQRDRATESGASPTAVAGRPDVATVGTVDAQVKAGVAESLSTATTAARASAALDSAATGVAGPGGGATTATPSVPAGPTSALVPTDIGRSIIFTATLHVEVDNVAAAADAAMTAIGGVGGFVYGQQATSDPVPTNVLTFKVAPKDFQTALGRLGGLGKRLDQQVSTDDVTERVVDMESRIAAAQTSVDRLRGFLAQATDVNTLASLERELLDRESQLEVMRGQLRTVQAQVDLATITLTLTQPAPDGPAITITATAYAGDADGTTACPGDTQLSAIEGERLTFCYELRNTGSTSLAQLRLDDPGLDLRQGDLRVVGGRLDAPLAPDQVVVLAATVDASLDHRPSPRVRAVAVDEAGEPLRTQVQTSSEVVELSVRENTDLPGFTTALRGGWRALSFVFGLLVLVLGAVLPFIWLVPLAYVGTRWLRRRRAARLSSAAPASAAGAKVAPAAVTVPDAPDAADPASPAGPAAEVSQPPTPVG